MLGVWELFDRSPLIRWAGYELDLRRPTEGSRARDSDNQIIQQYSFGFLYSMLRIPPHKRLHTEANRQHSSWIFYLPTHWFQTQREVTTKLLSPEPFLQIFLLVTAGLTTTLPVKSLPYCIEK